MQFDVGMDRFDTLDHNFLLVVSCNIAQVKSLTMHAHITCMSLLFQQTALPPEERGVFLAKILFCWVNGWIYFCFVISI